MVTEDDLTSIDIRYAVPADSEGIRSVHRRSIEGLGIDAYRAEQVTAWAAGCEKASYTDAITDTSMEFIVAALEEEIVGFGSLRCQEPTGYDVEVDGEVTGVYVDPSIARRGVGSALYLELERRALDRSIDRLGLAASKNAVAFYEQHGYTRVRAYSHEFSAHLDTGVEGTIVEMIKHISE